MVESSGPVQLTYGSRPTWNCPHKHVEVRNQPKAAIAIPTTNGGMRAQPYWTLSGQQMILGNKVFKIEESLAHIQQQQRRQQQQQQGHGRVEGRVLYASSFFQIDNPSMVF